jgi:hypothetical protein
VAAVSLSLALLVIAVVAARSATAPGGVNHPASRSNPAPIVSQGWPGATLIGSAYDGQ